MNARTATLDDIFSAIDGQNEGRRGETLARVADLFIDAAHKFDAQHIQLFDDVMMRLITRIEARALIELGRRLAGIPNAPAGVIGFLARLDEIAAAEPVLAQSDRLGQVDLIDICATKGQPHLLALARRSRIAKPVTDALIKQGNDEVVRSVAANKGAEFSEPGYGKLVERAQTDESIALCLASRPDLPEQILHSLLLRATGEMRTKLAAAVPTELSADVQRLLERIANDVLPEDEESNYDAIKRRLVQDIPDGVVKEDTLQQVALAKRRDDTIVALAVLCNVPCEMIEKILAEERIQPLLMLCKARNIGWPTVRLLVPFRGRIRESSVASLTELCGAYGKIRADSAAAALEFWRNRAQ